MDMEYTEPTILYNDGHLLAVDKPSGLLVAPDRWDKSAACLVEWVRGFAGTEWCNVHRLDRETSGVVLFGHGRAMVAALAGAFESRQVTKVYAALVRGRPARGRGAIASPLAADPRRRGKMIVDPTSGRPARTQYETRRTWPASERSMGVSPMRPTGETPVLQGVSLLELWPLTGRTHQLRVHLASIGCPILADPFYGAGAADHAVIPRLALHARRLTLTHPVTGESLTIESSLPQAFEDAMTCLSPGRGALGSPR